MTRPTSGTIGLAISAYGERASASAFADYLEICALKRRKLSLASLDEAIRDHGWSSDYRSLDIASDDDELPVSWADSLMSLVRERESALRGRYPFKISGAYVTLKASPSAASRQYVRLLRLTAAHAYGFRGRPSTDVVFERLVSAALQKRGLPSAPMGTGSRSNKTFVNALETAGKAVGLDVSRDPYPRQRFARDGKVDALSAITWSDGRPGQFTWLTQATVGESSTWISKMKEPDPAIWAGYLNETLAPQIILAIPHHVEPTHLAYLLATRVGTVADRLRLAGYLPDEVEGEDAIREWFEAAQVEL
ncbi:hypothetical protein [Leifsonia shinshuensis]|uniref:Uncharacterized protein n=1 Tax=Leifsonia shinshuensis TaxID=150026 RepID=A0A853CV20_9MICO|nr:hypothetical protein [Leifsonia shinshuensis]NYJ23044.1 hypothetical protein [Leifsonia shinshuensis]